MRPPTGPPMSAAATPAAPGQYQTARAPGNAGGGPLGPPGPAKGPLGPPRPLGPPGGPPSGMNGSGFARPPESTASLVL
jgi:hypothetical protein